MLGYALIDGFAQLERRPAIQRLKHVVALVDGVIADFAFDDEAVRLSVELEASALPRLRDALEAAGVHLFERSSRTVEASRALAPRRPVTALLHVTLVRDDLAKTA